MLDRIALTASQELLHANPFDSDLARANSSYAAFQNNALIQVLNPAQPPAPLLEFVHDALRASILSKRFSCVGAKAAMHRGDYRIGTHHFRAQVTLPFYERKWT